MDPLAALSLLLILVLLLGVAIGVLAAVHWGGLW